MTKFEQVGINHQYDAGSKDDAIKAFKHSCNVCCNRGMHIQCDKCGIACVHNLVVATFEERKVV